VGYEIYLESGPQRRKTWVYVPGLPGCSTVAPTSAEAIDAARAAIAERLDFLRRHGEVVHDGGSIDARSIEVVVADHAIGGKFLGFGQGTFPTDLEPTARDVAARQLRWSGWSRQELVAAARAQPRPLTVRPAAGGRSTAEILSHVAGAEWAYASSALGTVPGGSAAVAAIERAGEDPWEALGSERDNLMARLDALTDEELSAVVERGDGKPPRSVRRMLRRMLEHEWEHVRELNSRLR